MGSSSIPPNDYQQDSELPFEFASETTQTKQDAYGTRTWKVLSVEDNVAFQNTLELSLKNMEVFGQKIEFLKANNLAEASLILANHNDIIVVLMDVVMETDDAGLRLVRTIRDVMGNNLVRIILLTGQPGMAPQHNVMQDYDLDDYWCKSDLTHDRLYTLLTANIRSWLRISETMRARKGLQMIVDSSRQLLSRYEMNTFSEQMLKELEQLFNITDGNSLCLRRKAAVNSVAETRVIAGTGRYRPVIDKPVSVIDDPLFHQALKQVLKSREHIVKDDYSILFFEDEVSQCEYIAFLPTSNRPLDKTEIELMRVFTTNIQTGLRNIHLFNRISELAYWDKSLDIPNRHALLRELSITFNRASRDELLLLVIDLDGFANTNLVFGQDYGDQLLIAVANRLRRNFPTDIFVARIDADTFALLGNKQQLTSQSVHALFNHPFQLDSNEHLTSVCIAEIPLSTMPDSPYRILDMAGPTLTRAKELGPGRTATFNPVSVYDAEQRFRMLLELRAALEEEQGLTIMLQPKISLQNQTLVGFEALARWRSPAGDMIPPSTFIPLAESSGLVIKLGERVLQQTCQAIKTLHQAGIKVPVSFNASAEELGQDDFLSRLTQTIQHEGVPYDSLDLEITESAAMSDFANVTGQLKRLLKLGMSVSIDDFGTGYSSLNYLTIFPAKILKIDRSFVQRLGQDPNAEGVTDAIIKLAQQLHMEVIAEGVETHEQSSWLTKRGCETAQGFLYAKPMPLENVLEWAQQHGVGKGH